MSQDRPALGVWISPGLAQAYPELKQLLGRLYGERMADLAWLPTGWLDQVRQLQAENPSDLVRIANTYIGPVRTAAAPFAATVAQAEVWQALFTATNQAIETFAAGKVEEGRVLLDQLYANARFWNAAYMTASAVAGAPAAVLSATLSGVESVAGSILGRLVRSPLVWIAGLGLVLVLAAKTGAARRLLKRVRT